MPVDLAIAEDLRINHGLTYQQIASLQGVSKQAVHQQLAKILPEKDLIEPFRQYRADLIDFAQLKALTAYLSLDDEEQKDMIRRRGLVDLGIAYDKSRLEANLSTGNLAILREDIQSLRGYASARQSGGDPGQSGKLIDCKPVDNQAQKSPTNNIKELP